MFLGCHVGKFSDGDGWFMDLDLLDWEFGFDIPVLRRGEEKKAERLRSGEGQMTHAMALTAVYIEDGDSVRWRIQNSWAETGGKKGWFVRGHAWLDECTYQAVIHPRVVGSKVKDVSNMEPGLLPL
ncbi:peptidase C1B, bleomycin hydrolase [Coniochaeta sp. PMI_546]|nr:peptidase C1B, bleomycin hydrolase [Coniochaeta sp. PMI_546]